MSVRFADAGKVISTSKEGASLLSGASVFTALKSSQAQADQVVGTFVEQATDWRTLASMTAGGFAYRAGRIGVMGLGNGSLLRAASVGLGLTAEVSTFEFTHRALSSIRPGAQRSNLWSWNGPGGLRQGLLQSFITFGALKGAGRLTQAQNLIAQHLFQDTAMVLGHHATSALGIAPRPEGSLAEQFLHAEATNLQIGAGMALAHGFAPGLQALERGLDLFLAPPRVLEPRPSLLEPAWASATLGNEAALGRPFEQEMQGPTIFKMANQGGDGKGGGKPPKRWSFLTLLSGGEPPSTPRDLPPPLSKNAPKEVKHLDKAIQDLLEEGLTPQKFEAQRRKLEEILHQVSLSLHRSPEREFFFGLSRSVLSQIFDAMEYDAPPHPFQASHLRVVDEFRLSNETRDLLNETELRQYFGERFLTYETYRPEEVTVFQHLDEGQISLIVRSHALLKARKAPPSRSNAGKKIPKVLYFSSAEIKHLQTQIDEAFDNTECMIPGILLKYEPSSLKWLLEFWAPPGGIEERLFRTMIQGSLQELSKNPEMKNVSEIKIELRTRRSSLTVSWVRSLGKDGSFQFIPME